MARPIMTSRPQLWAPFHFVGQSSFWEMPTWQCSWWGPRANRKTDFTILLYSPTPSFLYLAILSRIPSICSFMGKKITEHLLYIAWADFWSYAFKYSQRPQNQIRFLGERNTIMWLFWLLPWFWSFRIFFFQSPFPAILWAQELLRKVEVGITWVRSHPGGHKEMYCPSSETRMGAGDIAQSAECLPSLREAQVPAL